MARPCTICARTDREAIDKAVVGGAPIRAIARQYRVSRDALRRHQAHVSAALVRVVAQRQEEEGESLLTSMRELIARTELLLEAAEKSGAVGLALSAIDRMWKGYELVAKMTGELQTGTRNQTINILTSPEVARVVRAMQVALVGLPDRMELFSQEMERLETEDAA